MPATNFLKDKLRKHVFGTDNYAKPAQLHFGLFTVAPTAAGGGTEVDAPSYARVQYDPGDSNWTFPASTGEANNTTDIQYAAPDESWGIIVSQAFFDEAGNMLGFENLPNPKTINAGDTAPKFPASSYKAIFG